MSNIYGTGILLIVGFILLIAVVFLFSAVFPSTFGDCVVVMEINQELVTQGIPATLFSDGMPGSEEIADKIRSIDKRPDVGAVVFVMDSPGGSVVATREIYDAIDGMEKPRVVYMREAAASGAYYISTPAEYIIADPNTVTGSIGVVAIFADMSELFEKVGVDVTAITSGSAKDMGSPARKMTEKEIEIVQTIVDEVFEEFKGVILKHRGSKLSMSKFNEILDGRIVSGRQAKEIGLVDALGTKRDAIGKAAELAGLPSDEVRICKVSFTGEEQGLFDVASIIKVILKEKQPDMVLRYE